MEHHINNLKLKMTNCFLVKGNKGYLMVDAGPPKCKDIFLKSLDELSVDPEDIKLIFITHGHWDHWGSLKDIQELTGAQTAINHREKTWLEDGVVRIPGGIGGWGKFIHGLLGLIKSQIKSDLETASVSMEIADKGLYLDEYGIEGQILHTPGHTPGSMSLLLDSGEAFVGDLAMSGFPRIGGPGPFVLGEDINAMKKSWQQLLNKGVKTIYPSHGGSFSAEVFKNYLKSVS